MKTCGVYRWLNSVTGESYVGSSLNIEGRRHKHLYQLRRGKSHSLQLQNAYCKYGEDSFHFEVLEVCETEQLEEAETRWCIALDSVANGYNCSTSVKAPTRGYKHTAATRARMSAAQRNLSRSPEQIEQARAQLRAYNHSLKGKPLTPEHRAAISAANMGRPAARRKSPWAMPEEQRAKMRGRTVSEESRRKMSASNQWRDKTGSEHFRSRPVVQWSLDGVRIADFPGASEAARQLGIRRESITNCVRGVAKTAHGFVWTYR